MKKRQTNEINAGSMADIAFLLLIFFLVTTTILQDQGIMARLPPIPDGPDASVLYDEEYVLSISINGFDEILMEKEYINLDEIKDRTAAFIQSRLVNKKNKQPVVALSCSRATSYSTYIDVYDRLKQAYKKLWDEKAWELFNKPYHQLPFHKKKQVRARIPLIISESEVTS